MEVSSFTITRGPGGAVESGKVEFAIQSATDWDAIVAMADAVGADAWITSDGVRLAVPLRR